MNKDYKILVHTKNAELIREFEALCGGKDFAFVALPDISHLVISVYDEMPHLVLVDLRRANVGGFDICRQLKTDAVLGHIPLIVLTDLADGAEVPESAADRILSRDEPSANVWYQIREIVETSTHALDVHPLTHLPGSRSSVERIEAVIQKGELFAMCAVHLRHLNFYYRTFGPRRGDALVRRTMDLLSDVAGRLFAGRSFVGHFGDRDFVVTMPPEKAVEFAERVIEQFESRLGGVSGGADEGKTEGVVTLSIAIVTNEKLPFRHIAEVVRTCEQIHRFLKRYPHNAYLKDRRTNVRELMSPISFEITSRKPSSQQPHLNDPTKKRHPASDLLMRIAAVIHSGEVEAYYQPIVDWSGQVRAHEALSRFKGSDGQPIDPIRMFQAARETDLIRELDVACAINVLRSATNLPARSKLFINLNRETLLDAASLERIWDNGFFDARRVVIEITEQSLIKQSSQVRSVMEGLVAKGVQIALDDAGGGSVSLREAAELKPHYIKFDKSIIRDIHSSDAKRKILLSLSVFARSMNATTVAEGIETEAEWLYLKQAGVDLAQGYFIAKPQPSPMERVSHLP